MGLDTSHDAFHGAYSAFNRFRMAVAKAIGGSFPPHDEEFLAKDGGVDTHGEPYKPEWWYWGEGYSRETHPGLYEFFMHSDCDGEIPPEKCRQVADELEVLLPEIAKLDDSQWNWGHVFHQGGFSGVTRKFIDGCRGAADAGEPLTFQ